MRELTPEERRKIANLMQSIKRQQKKLEARRFPKQATTAAAYIDEFNKINRAPYRERVTMEAFTCAAQ